MMSPFILPKEIWIGLSNTTEDGAYMCVGSVHARLILETSRSVWVHVFLNLRYKKIVRENLCHGSEIRFDSCHDGSRDIKMTPPQKVLNPHIEFLLSVKLKVVIVSQDFHNQLCSPHSYFIQVLSSQCRLRYNSEKFATMPLHISSPLRSHSSRFSVAYWRYSALETPNTPHSFSL